MPVIEDIEDDLIREETERLTSLAPDYFWLAPASNNHHPERFRSHHGLWAHTLTVAQAVKDLWWSFESRGAVSEDDRDLALSAAILHDQRKRGELGEEQDSAASDHDIIMADVVRQKSQLPDEVADAIETHMGASYDGPEPSFGTLGDLVHTADYAASREGWRIEVEGDHDLAVERLIQTED